MALVSYDYSDTSDVEEDNVLAADPPNCDISVLHKNEKQELNSGESSSSAPNLFYLLPQPSKKKLIASEEDDEFLHKKENATNAKPKAKITVPSLSDFKDVGETLPNVKPRMASGKKSGLLSMLPQPKNAVLTKTNNFVPHILTQKPSTAIGKTKKETQSLVTKLDKKVKAKESILQDYSDDSDNDDVQNDFFAMKKTEPPIDSILDINLNGDPEPAHVMTTISKNNNNTFDLNNYLKQDIDHEHAASGSNEAGYSRDLQESNPSNKHNSNAETSNANETVLDDEAILKLCGSRGKRKREDIQIVDVNQKEVLADAREWLVKGLMDDTTKRVSVSKRRGGEPTTQQKRKHQITYLAHQAKANEAELQNQWANNRMSKRQTQSKYGF